MLRIWNVASEIPGPAKPFTGLQEMGRSTTFIARAAAISVQHATGESSQVLALNTKELDSQDRIFEHVAKWTGHAQARIEWYGDWRVLPSLGLPEPIVQLADRKWSAQGSAGQFHDLNLRWDLGVVDQSARLARFLGAENMAHYPDGLSFRAPSIATFQLLRGVSELSAYRDPVKNALQQIENIIDKLECIRTAREEQRLTHLPILTFELYSELLDTLKFFQCEGIVTPDTDEHIRFMQMIGTLHDFEQSVSVSRSLEDLLNYFQKLRIRLETEKDPENSPVDVIVLRQKPANAA